MLHYTSLVCLLLFVSVVSLCHGQLRIVNHKAGPGKDYVIASKAFDHFSNFAVAEYGPPRGLPPVFKVTLRIYDENGKIKPKECFLKYEARWGAMKIGVSSLNRLNANKFVLTWYDELKDHTDLRTNIVVIEMDDNNCKRINIQHSSVAGNVIVVPTSENEFDLFVDDRYTCLGVGDRCRIIYKLDKNLLGLRRPFHDQFDWSTVNIERLPNEDLVVRGFLDDTYRIIRVHHDGTSPVIEIIPNAKRDLQFSSSGTSFCYVNATQAENQVNCTVFDKNDDKVFSKIVQFDDARVLLDIRKTRYDELMIVTMKKHCREDCWNLYSTTVRKNMGKPNHVTIPFKCTGDPKDLIVLDADYDDHYRKIDFYYVCRNENVYNLDVYYLSQQFYP